MPAPIAIWSLDEGSGVTSADTSGFNNNLEIMCTESCTNGPPAWVPGRSGTGLLFTYFQIARAPSSASLNQLTRAYTISFWVRRHLGHSDARPLIARLTAMANNTYLYLLTFDNDGRLFLTSGATTISDPNPVAQSFGPAGWVHFAAVFDGTHLRLYRAGVEVASAMAPNTLVASDAPLILGSQPIPPTGSGYASYADSALDEIRIYAVALTPAQIATLAQ